MEDFHRPKSKWFLFFPHTARFCSLTHKKTSGTGRIYSLALVGPFRRTKVHNVIKFQSFQERDLSLQCYIPLTLSKRLPLAVQGRINSSFLTRLYVYKCVAEVFCFKNLIAFMNRLLYEGHKIESFHVFHNF